MTMVPWRPEPEPQTVPIVIVDDAASAERDAAAAEKRARRRRLAWRVAGWVGLCVLSAAMCGFGVWAAVLGLQALCGWLLATGLAGPVVLWGGSSGITYLVLWGLDRPYHGGIPARVTISLLAPIVLTGLLLIGILIYVGRIIRSV
jgi:hypothetical protein